MSDFPVNFREVIFNSLVRDHRENDGLLHASSHLSGSLRHAQLDIAGAPQLPRSFVEEVTLKTGTLWHEHLHGEMRRLGVPYMPEVNLNPGMPLGWGGTADALIWSDEYRAYDLTDWKTQKGAGMRYIVRDGAKEEHRWQASLYWHAAKKMGFPLTKRVSVLYIPKDAAGKDAIEPVLVTFPPIAWNVMRREVMRRRNRVAEYLDSINGCWLTDALEPVQERVQKVFLDNATETWDVKLVPHWSTAYCPFPNELCDCRSQGVNKIGMYDVDGETYIPRKGFEDIEPTVIPA